MDALTPSSISLARAAQAYSAPAAKPAAPRDVLPFSLASNQPAPAGVQRPRDVADVSSPGAIRASRAADVASKLRARSMIAATVPGGVDFTVPPREPATARASAEASPAAPTNSGTPAALPFYRHPGLANQVMTSVTASRMVDVQG